MIQRTKIPLVNKHKNRCIASWIPGETHTHQCTQSSLSSYWQRWKKTIITRLGRVLGRESIPTHFSWKGNRAPSEGSFEVPIKILFYLNNWTYSHCKNDNSHRQRYKNLHYLNFYPMITFSCFLKNSNINKINFY